MISFLSPEKTLRAKSIPVLTLSINCVRCYQLEKQTSESMQSNDIILVSVVRGLRLILLFLFSADKIYKKKSTTDQQSARSLNDVRSREVLTCANGVISTKHRLAGEIAYELDNRIIDYIFNDGHIVKKRYYGYTTNNITEMIDRETFNETTSKKYYDSKELHKVHTLYICGCVLREKAD